MHSTYNLEDGYLGSGLIVKRSIEKYGKDNHIKEVVSYHDPREDLIKEEKSLVTEEVIDREFCMNIRPGGTGGFTIEHQRMAGSLSLKSQWERRKENPELMEEFLKICSNNLKEYINKGTHNYSTFKGRFHSQESKDKMSKNSQEPSKGEKNSQFGTCWIYNSEGNKKINKLEIEKYISLGWTKGRKMNLRSCS